MVLLFPGIRPAITNYMTPQARIFINHSQMVADCSNPQCTHINPTNGGECKPCLQAGCCRIDKTCVVACFYQGPDFSPLRPLCRLVIGKIKIDETLLWPMRYWFYRLVSLAENLRAINYKIPPEWPDFVFPSPVFESQHQVNFFSFALVYLNDFATFDALTFDRFKSLLTPLVTFFQPSEGLLFNRHLLNFILSSCLGPNRKSDRAQIARFLREFLSSTFSEDRVQLKRFFEDIDAFTNNLDTFGLSFDAFKNIDGEIFVHHDKSYTWAALG